MTTAGSRAGRTDREARGARKATGGQRWAHFGTVVRFEVVRTLRKPAFWIGTLAIPVIMVVVGLLVGFSSSSAVQSANDQQKASFAFEYHDASGLIDPATAGKLGGASVASADQGVADVKAGTVAAFFDYPADPSSTPVAVSGQDVGVFDNGKYGAVAQALLKASVATKIGSPVLTQLAQNGASVTTTAYQGNAVSRSGDAVVPGMLFVLLLFLAIALMGQSVLAATAEEKENRVVEMLVTSVRSDTVILGKIVALTVTGVVQMAVISLPAVIGFLFFRDKLALPDLDLSHAYFDPQTTIVGVLILIPAFLFAMTTLVAIGSAVPNAKDAGPFYAVAIVGTVIPLYLAAYVISNPTAFLSELLTHFPYSAGETAMLRNAFGTLPLWQAIVVMAELWLCALVMLRIAVRVFRRGSVEYTQRVSLRQALGLPPRGASARR